MSDAPLNEAHKEGLQVAVSLRRPSMKGFHAGLFSLRPASEKKN